MDKRVNWRKIGWDGWRHSLLICIEDGNFNWATLSPSRLFHALFTWNPQGSSTYCYKSNFCRKLETLPIVTSWMGWARIEAEKIAKDVLQVCTSILDHKHIKQPWIMNVFCNYWHDFHTMKGLRLLHVNTSFKKLLLTSWVLPLLLVDLLTSQDKCSVNVILLHVILFTTGKEVFFNPFILLIWLTECRITKKKTPILCIHTQNPGGGA